MESGGRGRGKSTQRQVFSFGFFIKDLLHSNATTTTQKKNPNLYEYSKESISCFGEMVVGANHEKQVTLKEQQKEEHWSDS